MFRSKLRSALVGIVASLLAMNASAALINIYEYNGGIGSIAQAESIVASASAPSTTANSNNIWFSDVGTYGASPFPGNHNTTFVLTAEGTVDTAEYSHLYVAHDDGIELSIDNSVIYQFNGNTDLRGSSALYLGGNTGIRDLSMLFWENGGEADLFLWGYNRDGSGWERAFIGDPADVPEPATLSLFGLGIVALGFARRKSKQVQA